MSADTLRAEDMRMDLGAMFGAVLQRWLRVLIITALLCAVTYGLLMFVPKMYESQSGLLVEERANITAGTPSASSASISIDAMMSSQIELIKSRDTLLSVIESEHLGDVPELASGGSSPLTALLSLIGKRPEARPEARSSNETVLQNLNERLTVVRERDSAVISIIVRTTDPQLSARIANSIAATHVQRRAQQSLADTAEASTWLQGEIDKLRKKVADADTAVANYRVANNLLPGSNNTTLLDQQISTLATQISAAQERQNTAQSRANLIRGLISQGQPIDGVPDVQNSVVIQQLAQSRAALQGEFAQRSSTLLGNHPIIKALRAQIGELTNQINNEGKRVAAALDASAKIEADLVASLNKQLAGLRQNASTATRDSVTLDSLQREAKAQRDLLESYLARYSDASARTDSNAALPDVRQITLAAPSVGPASPKVALTVGAVAFVALAVQIGAILFGELMSGRAITERLPRRETDAVLVDPETAHLEAAVPARYVPASPQAQPVWEVQVDQPEPGAGVQEEDEHPAPTVEQAEEGLSTEAAVLDREHEPAQAGSLEYEQEASHDAQAEAELHRDLDDEYLEAEEEARADSGWEPRPELALEVPGEPELPLEADAGPVDYHADEFAAVADPVASTPEEGDERVEEEFAALAAEETEQVAEQPIQGEELIYSDPAMSDPEEQPATAEPVVMEEPVVHAAPLAQDPTEIEAADTDAEQEPAPSLGAVELSNLSADLGIGRVRIVLLAGLMHFRDSLMVADRLTVDALRRGLSVARVDAGSGKNSTELGLTDLTAGEAGFGDVVHKIREGVAEVPWGHLPAADLSSTRAVTLVEALADIYEVVIVVAGPVSPDSSLKLFSGLTGRMVLVSPDNPPAGSIQGALRNASELGFEVTQIVGMPTLRPEVA